MVDDAVAIIRWRIERVKLQGNIAGIDDVVIDGGNKTPVMEQKFRFSMSIFL